MQSKFVPGRSPHAALGPLVVTVSGLAQTPPYRDADFDGLDDALEHQLLQRHRPILAFEDDERHWPISAERFVANSRLLWRGDPDEVVAFTRDQLAADPRLALLGHTRVPNRPSATAGPGGPGFGGVGPGGCSCRTDWFLDLDDTLRSGVYPQPDGRDHEGMYGHVVPVDGERILIQYWQLLPHNDAGQISDCGDHEGDWLYLDAYVSRSTPHQLLELVYHHHGDGNCPPTRLTGADLPADGVPTCYIEEQAHEWWPWPSGGGECEFFIGVGNPSHHGNGIVYRVPIVENIGERTAPMPGSLAAELILRFNGRWGGWGAYCNFLVYALQSGPPNSPIHQFFPAPPGLDQFPPPPQAYSLGEENIQAVALNNAGTVLLHRGWVVGGSSFGATSTVRPCLKSFDDAKFQRHDYGAEPNVCDAGGRCLSESGHVGGSFWCYLGRHDGVVWSSPDTWLLPVWDNNPTQPAWGVTVTSLHSTDAGMVGLVRGHYGSVARYRNGRLTNPAFTGIPSNMSWNGGNGRSNARGDFIGSLYSWGYSIAAKVGRDDRVTPLESGGYHSSANDIDSAGNVVGSAHGWARFWPTDNPAAPVNLWQGNATCINDRLEVAGSGTGGAYLWWGDGHGAVRPLIAPAARPHSLDSLTDLNDHGWAIGSGYLTQSNRRPMLIDTRPRSTVSPAAPTALIHRDLILTASTSGRPQANRRWYRNGVPLVDGSTPRGSIVSGATTPQLRIRSLDAADAGYYQFAADPLESTLAEPALVTIRCGGDFNRDHMLDVGDIFAFLTAWFAADSAADINASGTRPDLADLFEFLTLYLSGC